MGGCATKPTVLKDDDTNAPAPEPAPEKGVVAGVDIDKEVVDDDPANKHRSLSNLFEESEQGKDTSENAKTPSEPVNKAPLETEDPTNVPETKSATEEVDTENFTNVPETKSATEEVVDSTIKAIAGEQIEIPPVTDTKYPETTEGIKTTIEEKEIDPPKPEIPQEKKPEENKPVLVTPKPEETKPVLDTTPKPEIPQEKKTEETEPVLVIPKPEETKPVLVTPKPEEPKPVLDTPKPEIFEEKKATEVQKPEHKEAIEIQKTEAPKSCGKPEKDGPVEEPKIEEKPVNQTQKTEASVEFLKPATEVEKVAKEAQKTPEETKIQK